MSVEDVIEQLGLRRNDALSTLELLSGSRQEAEAHRAQLENPQAVSEYIAFFEGFIGRAVAECDRVLAELAGGLQPSHIDALRQLAGNSAAELRRCLQFRDKVINKPLPYEVVRPLLNDISITTRDQLTAFQDLGILADRLEALVTRTSASPDTARAFGRRALFTRILKP